MITTVTFTGADDSVHPTHLFELQKKYPFVEWAILFSSKRTGTNRYPSTKWQDELFESENPLSLSAHLCGDYAKRVLQGDTEFLDVYGVHFNRVQINRNFSYDVPDIDILCEVMESYSHVGFILQYNKSNEAVCLEMARHDYPNLNFLYDSSGGRGTLLGNYKEPIKRHFTGYAGGISPDNIISVCEKVNAVSKGTDVWIDMESHVRSNEDTIFDLTKVESCLLKAENFIKEFAD